MIWYLNNQSNDSVEPIIKSTKIDRVTDENDPIIRVERERIEEWKGYGVRCNWERQMYIYVYVERKRIRAWTLDLKMNVRDRNVFVGTRRGRKLGLGKVWFEEEFCLASETIERGEIRAWKVGFEDRISIRLQRWDERERGGLCSIIKTDNVREETWRTAIYSCYLLPYGI